MRNLFQLAGGRQFIAVIFAVLAALIAGVGYLVFDHERKSIGLAAERNLTAIGDLKARQITAWIEERKATSKAFSRHAYFADETAQWVHRGAPEGRAAWKLRLRLAWIAESYGYKRVSVFDIRGRILLSTDKNFAIAEADIKAANEAIGSSDIAISDFHFSDEDGKREMEIDIFAPLYEDRNQDAPVAILAFDIDPDRYLYPLIQAWPVPSRSGEAILVERDGDQVLFLSKLRFRDDAPLNLRLPAAQPGLVAATGLNGRHGIVEGLDYRGVAVLADVRPIPDTPWMMVTKIDADEVYGPVRKLAFTTAMLTAFLIFAAALTTLAWARARQARQETREAQLKLQAQAIARHYGEIGKYVNDIIVLADENGQIVDVNDRAVETFGYSRAELLKMNVRDTRAPSTLAAFEQDRSRWTSEGAVYETTLRAKDGRDFPVEASVRMLEVEGKRFVQAVIRDITRRKLDEERIRTLNRLYLTLSESNSAMVRSTSRRELCQHICRLATEKGGWVGAWVGFVDGATKHIVAEAWSDSMAPHIGRMAVSIDPAIPEGQGPTGIAARTGAPYFCNDIFADPATLPWRQFAKNFGIASVAAVPLRLGNAFTGVINLYAKQKDFYTPDVQALLIELSNDVSFALDAFDRESRRQQAESALAENEAKFRSLIEQSIVGIYIIQDGMFAYVNPRFAEIIGYDAQELIGKDVLVTVAEPHRALVQENIRKRVSGTVQNMHYTFVGRRKDGSNIDIGVHGSRAVFQGKPAVIGVMQDISERKKAEEAAKQYLVQLEKSMFGTIDAVSTMIELRDPYTSGHERRVGDLAAAIGAELGLSQERIQGLRITGYVHDIGKIAIPAEILSKPGKLTATEFEIIKTHARQGYEILKSVEFPWPVAQAILQHHERLDGSGYPNGLKDGQIMLEARILAVADTVEAMTTHRPYRPGLGIEAALKEIEEQSGKRYDAQVVAACLRLFREKNYQLPA